MVKKYKFDLVLNVYIYVVAFILTTKILDFEISDIFYYVTIVMLFGGYFLSFASIKILDLKLLIFCVFLFFTIALNDIPSFFSPYSRYISFLLVICVFSSIFTSVQLLWFRNKIFHAIIHLFILYTIVSFIGLLLGIFPLLGYGGFQGILNHSMTMSPVASISALYLMYMFFQKNKNKFFLIGFVICLFVVIIGASRSALGALLLGLAIFLYKSGYLKIRSLPKFVLVFLLLGSSLFLVPESYFEKINQKFEIGKDGGSILYSRGPLWDVRFSEFKSSPIYGIGFSVVDVKLDTKADRKTGIIEPGSAWLSLLSMTGILGSIIFLSMIISRLISIYKSNFSLNNSLIISVFVFFLLHLIFEGYIFASGNVLMILFWINYFLLFSLERKECSNIEIE